MRGSKNDTCLDATDESCQEQVEGKKCVANFNDLRQNKKKEQRFFIKSYDLILSYINTNQASRIMSFDPAKLHTSMLNDESYFPWGEFYTISISVECGQLPHFCVFGILSRT